MINLEGMWQEYGLDELERGMNSLFPEYDFSLSQLFEKVMAGDIAGMLMGFAEGIFGGVFQSLTGMKNVLLWLLVLGVISALMTHFVEIFDRHQIADLSFYFMYLLMTAVLLKSFLLVMQTAADTVENIVLFVKLLVPTYLMVVGIATGGTATVTAYYQLLIFLIYGVEKLLAGVVLPLIYGYGLLSMINGVWIEEKLTLFLELMEKLTGFILKAAIGLVTGISIFQAVITPTVDSLKTSAFQKALSMLPGVGGAAEGVAEMVLGSAVVIKNSIGVILLILLLILCAAPLLEILLMGLMLKAAAAFMGIVSNKRITMCVSRTGDACLMLFRTTGTAMLLFLITLSAVALVTNR